MKTGKFIVIEGTDGSGKATQAKILFERLEAEGTSCQTISFPQYSELSSLPIKKYLANEYGPAGQVNPRLASTLYAIDRWMAKDKIARWLKDGITVVCDRYVASNIGHQGSKFHDAEERRKFIEWDHTLEYGDFAIPSPDLNVILHVKPEITIELMKKRGGKLDAHELDIDHLRAAERSYLDLAAEYPESYTVIECSPGDVILSQERIHEMIWEKVSEVIG